MTLRQIEQNKAFYNFLEMQLQLFKGHLMVTKASKDEEAIHQMRVAIKRIRTIQTLKKNIGFPVKIPNPVSETIKTIFSTSGKLRDLQIQTALLQFYQKLVKSSLSELEDHLSQTRIDLNTLIDKTIHEIDLHAMEDLPQLPESGFEIDIEKECLDFITKKMTKIDKLLIFLSDEEKVHELRKQVKHLYFILQFLSEQIPGNPFYEYDLKNLKKITDAIGFWNDHDFFRQMVVGFVSGQETGFLKNNPEYQILFYLIANEKRKFLLDIDVELYLELIRLKSLPKCETLENQDIPDVENRVLPA